MNDNPMSAQYDVCKSLANGTDCVAVACKLPHGILMQVGTYGETSGRDKYGFARIKGCRATSHTRGVDSVAAVTYPVPRTFVERWMKEHSWMVPVKEGLIKVFDSPERATAHAYSTGDQRHGLEPLKGPDAKIEVDEEHMNRVLRSA